MRAIVAGLVTVCLALLGYIGAVKVAPKAEVFTRIDAALEREHVEGVRVAGVERAASVAGDDRVVWRAILEGQVRSLGAKADAERIVKALPDLVEVDGDRLVVSASETGGGLSQNPPNPVSDPRMAAVVFSLSWDAGRVSVSGKLPSDVASEIPRAIANQFPAAVMTTDLQSVPGPSAPALRGVIDSAARALSVARRGKVEIRDGEFFLSATYGAAETASSVRTLVTEKVGVVLRTTLVTRVEAGPLDVADVTAVADVAADSSAASAGVSDVQSAEAATAIPEAGPAEVVADAVGVEASGNDVAEVADATMGATAASDSGPSDAADAGMTDPGGALTPAQCKALIDQLVAGEKRITFKGAKELTPDADAKVQQIAALLARCPDAKTTVSGYHDDYGEPDHINAITGMRANAVFKRLIELGIDKARLKWRGRGYANMRYSTRTQGSRVLNQRIEFDIVLGAP